jgi:hypothetical protein
MGGMYRKGAAGSKAVGACGRTTATREPDGRTNERKEERKNFHHRDSEGGRRNSNKNILPPCLTVSVVILLACLFCNAS